MNIAGLLHMGDVLFIVLLWAVTFVLQKITLRVLRFLPYQQYKTTMFYNRFNVVLWAFFVLLSVLYLGNKSLLFTVFLIVSAALAFWSFWRDFFAYVMIQFSNEIHENETIQWQNLKGTVKRISTRNIYLESDSGKLEIIPLHLFVSNAYTKMQQINRPLKHTFTINDDSCPEEIRKKLFMSPWVIKHLPLSIEKTPTGYRITCYTFNKNTAIKITV